MPPPSNEGVDGTLEYNEHDRDLYCLSVDWSESPLYEPLLVVYHHMNHILEKNNEPDDTAHSKSFLIAGFS